jgi:heme-degrading monooxygenase HmoA
MVIAIFRSRLRPEHAEEFGALAPRILDLARSMPGFLSYKSFTADDSERVSLIEFDSLPHLEAWRDHPEHRRAQELGRARFYAQYELQICEPLRAASFDGHSRGARRR